MTLKEELEFADYLDDLDFANKMIDLMAKTILNLDDQLVINHYKNKEEVIERFKELVNEYSGTSETNNS